MDKKAKTRRLKIGALAAFLLPFIAIGASTFSKEGQNTEEMEEHCCREKTYGNSTPRDPLPYGDYAAETADYYEQPMFVFDYYANLVDHFPINNVGNCGFVASAMLLSYYDTYWNENIIPWDYNNQDPTQLDSFYDTVYSSPGVNDPHEELEYSEEMPESFESMDPEKVRHYKEVERNAYLLYYEKMIAHKDYGIISLFYEIAKNSKPLILDLTADDVTPGINGLEVQELLNLYLDSLGFSDIITPVLVDFDTYPSSLTRKEKHLLLRQEAISRITNGQPIIYMGDLMPEKPEYDEDGFLSNGNGHHALAYGYEKGSDEIIGHLGWKQPGASLVSFDRAFGDFNGFLYLDISPELLFTIKNYRFELHGPLAACDLPNHIHGNYEKIPYGDNIYHALQCICGDVKYEMHDFTVEIVNGLFHDKSCPCGHSHREVHHFVQRGFNLFVCDDCGFEIHQNPYYMIP